MVFALTGARAQEEPALPVGLAEEEAPALPPGLDSDESPALPPGLDAEPTAEEAGPESPAKTRDRRRRPMPIHGFWEVRGGVRTGNDPVQPRDATLGETRLQLETEKRAGGALFESTADVYGDAVLEKAEFDLRRLRLTWSPLDFMDLRAGRQVLTWGVGDLVFINDLFPKDWQSFFIGRDVEYLKAPADAVKIGLFAETANVEFVYTPQFEPDRYITGERISFWDPLRGRRAGRQHQVDANPPSDWFEDDEFALRIYRTVGRAELAAYAYSGYWKSPAGQRLIPMQATFPKLAVYGASLRSTLGKGVINIETGYYDSRQDRDGDNPFINNSEYRLLVGYKRELATEFTGAVQYYLEHMMDYRAYRNTLPRMIDTRDKDRHVFTLRLTKLLMQQNLTLSLFGYYSPSDGDAYLRPRAQYKASDQWTIEAGGNVFLGEADHTFFGQFEDNTNIYTAARYAF